MSSDIEDLDEDELLQMALKEQSQRNTSYGATARRPVAHYVQPPKTTRSNHPPNSNNSSRATTASGSGRGGAARSGIVGTQVQPIRGMDGRREVRKLYEGRYYSGTVAKYEPRIGWYRVVCPFDVSLSLRSLASRVARRELKHQNESKIFLSSSRSSEQRIYEMDEQSHTTWSCQDSNPHSDNNNVELLTENNTNGSNIAICQKRPSVELSTTPLVMVVPRNPVSYSHRTKAMANLEQLV